eukprot:11803651-Ditylum_brightwellii.AAC.1
MSSVLPAPCPSGNALHAWCCAEALAQPQLPCEPHTLLGGCKSNCISQTCVLSHRWLDHAQLCQHQCNQQCRCNHNVLAQQETPSWSS